MRHYHTSVQDGSKKPKGEGKYLRITLQIPVELEESLRGGKFRIDYTHPEGILLTPIGRDETSSEPITPPWLSRLAREQDA